jgi:uncharacterized membrane protein YgdD (TMEM256/DUF423 family)
MTPRTTLATGALLAGLAVAAGAFGAHALQARIPAERLATYEVAVRYQMYHALALIALALVMDRFPDAGVAPAAWLFLAGVLIFGGTLYTIALGGPRWLGAITPIGGVCLILGWVLVAWRMVRAAS